MHFRDFCRSGHWPTLVGASIYFGVSTMIWVLIGGLGNAIALDIPMSDFELGVLVAVPILGGSLLRLVFGPISDYLGARRTGILGLSLTMLPLFLGWSWADSYPKLILVGILLGSAGASFAVALPLTSRWYSPREQGLVMGIVGVGNVGSALTTFCCPFLAETWGWHAVFGLALAPVSLTFLMFLFLTADSPRTPVPNRWVDYVAAIRQPDTWWFCLFYGVSFGGFVGLASFLGIFFHRHYGLSSIHAGTLATVCVLAGSLLRPVGGYLADQVGGIHLLTILYFAVGILLLDLSTSPPMIWGIFVLVLVVGLLGLGNGAVFQLVPQRFPKEIGTVTGLVGAAGGLGGFLLPMLLGGAREMTGSFSIAFLFLAAAAFASAIVLINVSQAWKGVFVDEGGRASAEPVFLGQASIANHLES